MRIGIGAGEAESNRPAPKRGLDKTRGFGVAKGADWSGRGESNPRLKLGKLLLYH